MERDDVTLAMVQTRQDKLRPIGVPFPTHQEIALHLYLEDGTAGSIESKKKYRRLGYAPEWYSLMVSDSMKRLERGGRVIRLEGTHEPWYKVNTTTANFRAELEGEVDH